MLWIRVPPFSSIFPDGIFHDIDHLFWDIADTPNYGTPHMFNMFQHHFRGHSASFSSPEFRSALFQVTRRPGDQVAVSTPQTWNPQNPKN